MNILIKRIYKIVEEILRSTKQNFFPKKKIALKFCEYFRH